MRLKQLGCGAILLSMLVTGVARSFAQVLIDRVPDDAMIYVGWKGTDDLGPAYEKSKLKQFVEHSAIPELFDKTLPDLIQKQSNNEPGKVEDFKVGAAFFKMIARHPTAFYAGGMETQTADDEPRPEFGLICQAGADKDMVLAVFSRMVADNKDQTMPLRALSDGDVVALVGGYDKDVNPLVHGTKSLGATADFATVKSRLTKDAAVVAFADVAKMLARVDMAMKVHNEQGFTAWNRAKEASGLAGLKRLVYSAGFAGEDWTSQSFIEAPLPRKGLVKLLEPAPIDPALVARVPADATSASIRQFDFAQLIDTAKAITTAANPEAGQKFQQLLGFVALSLGRKLDSELLAPLGAQWAV